MTFPHGLFPPPFYPKVFPGQTAQDAYDSAAFAANPTTAYSNWQLRASNRNLWEVNAYETPAWDPAIQAFRPFPIAELVAAGGGSGGGLAYTNLTDVTVATAGLADGAVGCIWDLSTQKFRASDALRVSSLDNSVVIGGLTVPDVQIFSENLIEFIHLGMRFAMQGQTMEVGNIGLGNTLGIHLDLTTLRCTLPDYEDNYGTPAFPQDGLITKLIADTWYSRRQPTEDRLTDLESLPPNSNPNAGGFSLIFVGASPFVIPCATAGQGVFTKVDIPIADLVVGQSGTHMNPTLPGDGEVTYADPLTRVYALSPKLNVRTLSLTGPEVIACQVRINGTPANGGLLEIRSLVDSTHHCTLSIGFTGTPVSTGDVLSEWVANLSSATDVEVLPGSFLLSGASVFLP